MAEQQEYQVTARKWRPAEFDSVVGQEHVTQTLKNAIKSGRLHHAYLFSGPRGVGKTTTARILAKSLNCQNRGEDLEPCNACDSCRQITEGRSLDVVEIDGASNNSVEDVRKLRDNAKYPPVSGSYKLYIIDEVHMLSTSAFNALLKTLEEPPRHLIFIFATTEPHKVPATILSRCQRFDFRRMQIADIVGRLTYISEREGYKIDEDALIVVAKKADGSMRDAQSIFDQVTSFCGPNVTYQQANEALNLIDQEFYFRVSDMMRTHDTAEAFAVVEHIMRTGYDAQEFLIGLAEHFRNFLTILTTGSARLVETAKSFRDRYLADSQGMQQGDLIRALHLTLGAQQAIRSSSQPRLRLELTLVQLAVMDSTVSLTQLLEKIDRIPDEGARAGGGGASRTPASTSSAPMGGGDVSDSVAAPASRYSARIAEQLKEGGERRGGVKDIASFPMASPNGTMPTARLAQEAFASQTDVATVGIAGGAFAPMYGDGDTAVSVVPAAPVAKTSGLPTIYDIRERWGEFLRSCDDKKILLASLQEVQPAELYGTTIRLYVADASHATIIARNSDVVATRLRETYGAPLQIEVVKGTVPGMQPQRSSLASPEVSARNTDHPFVKGLIDLLGAGPV